MATQKQTLKNLKEARELLIRAATLLQGNLEAPGRVILVEDVSLVFETFETRSYVYDLDEFITGLEEDIASPEDDEADDETEEYDPRYDNGVSDSDFFDFGRWNDGAF